MILLSNPRTRHRRLEVAAAAAGLLAALLTAAPAVATPDPGDAPATSEEVSRSVEAELRAAIAEDEIPAPDQIVHSANLKHLVNVPKDVLPGTTTCGSRRWPTT